LSVSLKKSEILILAVVICWGIFMKEVLRHHTQFWLLYLKNPNFMILQSTTCFPIFVTQKSPNLTGSGIGPFTKKGEKIADF
jgi:hypothetical protein